MSKFLAAILVLGLSRFASAQATDEELKALVQEKFRAAERALEEAVLQRRAEQDDAELKARILEKVRAKLSADRAALLKRIEKIIDEELATPAAKKPTPGKAEPKGEPEGDAKVKDLERKMRLLEEQKETLAAEMAKAKRQAGDEGLREEARRDGPHDAEEAQEMFDNALELHDKDKNYRESIKLFKRIYYNFPKTRVGSIAAYNAACGYALSGSKEEAIDWLEYSVKAGYNDFDHLRKDTDLDGLRNEKRYKKLLTDR
jgi:hypothetical protein